MLSRKLLVIGVVMLGSTPAIAQSTHSVRGYTRADGTYVAPHMQTNPNSTKLDNWSTRGNVNPYTGVEGTKDPYAPSTSSSSRTRSSSDPYRSPY